jgi:tripartite-type tricarboxylate transporter receptor subunit TctC
MKLPRRRFLHLAACAVTLPAGSRVARSQNYPARPVRIIVGFSAGGTTDIIARLIAQGLSERLGQQFIIENRPVPTWLLKRSRVHLQTVIRCSRS